MAVQKIPVTVITGFLGAGKTSLIRHLISNAQGKKMALLINEFGDLGVDGELLKGCGDETCTEDDIVELTNGCICCTVADDFLPTLSQLLDRRRETRSHCHRDIRVGITQTPDKSISMAGSPVAHHGRQRHCGGRWPRRACRPVCRQSLKPSRRSVKPTRCWIMTARLPKSSRINWPARILSFSARPT